MAAGALCALAMAANAAASATPGRAVGALAGATYAYGPYHYGTCSWRKCPAYDASGNFAGYAPVKVCY